MTLQTSALRQLPFASERSVLSSASRSGRRLSTAAILEYFGRQISAQRGCDPLFRHLRRHVPAGSRCEDSALLAAFAVDYVYHTDLRIVIWSYQPDTVYNSSSVAVFGVASDLNR